MRHLGRHACAFAQRGVRVYGFANVHRVGAQLDGPRENQGFLQRSHPLNGSGVAAHHAVGREQRDALHRGLCHQDAVKRVLVNGRQAFYKHGVRTGDGQLRIAMVQQAAPERTGIHAEIFASQAVFDDDLPHAGRAEQQCHVRVIQKRAV